MNASNAITVAEMRAVERAAEASGMSSLDMMRHAGENAATLIAERILNENKAAPIRVLFLCGPGNNGGDGLVCAAALHDLLGNKGVAQVYLLRPRLESDPVFVPLRERGLFVADAENDLRLRVFHQLISHANVIVDAVLGIGSSRPIGSHLKEMLDVIRDRRRLTQEQGGPALIALDGVSGMNYDTGALDPNVVPADITITFHAPKVGHFRSPAKEATGQLLVAGIGIA